MNSNGNKGARFERAIGSRGAVVVNDVTLTDAVVVREARNWTTGRRGEPCETPADLDQADLSAFVTEAVILGARALAVTAQTSETRAVEQMLKDVTDKTTQAASSAATTTSQAMTNAVTAVTKATADAKKAITEADEQTRKDVIAVVQAAKRDLNGEVARLFGGESPELLERLRPLLDQFGTGLEAKVQASTGALLDKVARQFDPADPTSPMAKHTATMKLQQQALSTQIDKNHGELTTKMEELATIVKLNEARASLAKVTPIKGGTFEDQIHFLMDGIAAGLGEEYTDTASTVGHLQRSKKGDGVLTIAAGAARVVLEMTDSARNGWNDYLDEAERNRGASGALGLVRTADQNGGQALRVLGSRRVVMAFDPETDDPELLRTVILLLRAVALTATSRTGAAEIATAEEKIADALGQLEKIDTIKTAASAIQKNATKIDSESTSIRTAIQRLLDEVLIALAGAAPATEPPVTPGIEAGAA
jgi:hypothetical protein